MNNPLHVFGQRAQAKIKQVRRWWHLPKYQKLTRVALAVAVLALAGGVGAWVLARAGDEVNTVGNDVSGVTIGSDEKTSEGGHVVKKAEMSEDAETVTITIDAEITEQTPKILFAQGTLCTAHYATNDVILSALNAILQYADVDYFYSSEPDNRTDNEKNNGVKIRSDDVTTFTKGSTVKQSDIGGMLETTGTHIALGTFLEDFETYLTADDYDMVVLVFDGYRSANGVITAYNSYREKLLSVVRSIQSLQNGNSIIYLLPKKDSSDKVVYDDVNYTSQINKYDTDCTTATACAYLSIGGLLDPTNWLKLVDSEGNYVASTMPAVTYFELPKNLVYYDDAGNVGNYLSDLQTIDSISIDDTLVEGLSATEADVTVQEYNADTGQYETLTSGFTVEVNGQEVVVKFDYSDQDVRERKVRIIITANASVDLGASGEKFPTNDGDACLKQNSGDTAVQRECVDSPELQKATRAKLKIVKSSANEAISGGNANYSLAGATYVLYTDLNCTTPVVDVDGNVVTFTTDANGDTDISGWIYSGTYYLKETVAPAGYVIDAVVHEVTLTTGGITLELGVTDIPISGMISLTKVSANEAVTTTNSNYVLSGAVYTLYTSKSQSGEVFGTFTTDSIGNGTLSGIPIGTYYLKETTASSGYKLDDSWYEVTVTTGTTSISVSSSEPPITHQITTSADHCSISGNETDIPLGAGRTVTYAPESGYLLGYVEVDGERIAIETFAKSYTFDNIIADHSVKAVCVQPEMSKTVTVDGQDAGGKVVNAGDTLTYSISYANPTTAAYTITITDTIPDGLTDCTAGNSGTISGNTATWTIKTSAGQSGTVTLTCTVSTSAYDTILTNVAKEKFTPTNNESLPSVELSDSVSNSVLPPPSKDVYNSDGEGIEGAIITVGTVVNYTVTTKNPADETKSFTITDPVPAGLAVDESSISDNGTYDSSTHTITWTLDISAHTEKTVSFKATAEEPTDLKAAQLYNQATVKVDLAEGKTTTDNGPCQESEECYGTPVYVLSTPVKTVQDAEGNDINGLVVDRDDTLTYTIHTANPADDARYFVITDTLPEHTTFISADNGGVYDSSTRTVTWTLNLEARQDITVSFTVDIDDGAGDTIITNQARVSAYRSGYNPEDDPSGEESPEAEADTNEVENPVLPEPVKDILDADGNSVAGSVLTPGDLITYTITVTNPADETKSFTVTDTLPAVGLVASSVSDNATLTLMVPAATYDTYADELATVAGIGLMTPVCDEDDICYYQLTLTTGKLQADNSDIPDDDSDPADLGLTAAEIDSALATLCEHFECNLAWNFDLAAHETKTLTFQVTVPTADIATKLYNQAHVSVDLADEDTRSPFDPDCANADETCKEHSTPFYILADPVKAVYGQNGNDIDGQPIEAESTLTYTITATNPTDNTRAFTIVDPLPANTVFLSASSGGVYDSATHTVTWTLALVANASVTVSVDIAPTADAVGSTIENTASVSVDNPNGIPSTPVWTNIVENPVIPKTPDTGVAFMRENNASASGDYAMLFVVMGASALLAGSAGLGTALWRRRRNK